MPVKLARGQAEQVKADCMAVPMQISCINVRSYGLVCPPANLPLSLESLTLTTRSWGRRVGPSLLLPPPRDLPNLQVPDHHIAHVLQLSQPLLWTQAFGSPCQGKVADRCLTMSGLPKQEITLEATCFICQDGSTSVANFLGNCKQLHSFTLLSDRKAVDYQPLTDEMGHLKKSTWVPL